MIKKFYDGPEFTVYKIFDEWIRMWKTSEEVEISPDGYHWHPAPLNFTRMADYISRFE